MFCFSTHYLYSTDNPSSCLLDMTTEKPFSFLELNQCRPELVTMMSLTALAFSHSPWPINYQCLLTSFPQFSSVSPSALPSLPSLWTVTSRVLVYDPPSPLIRSRFARIHSLRATLTISFVMLTKSPVGFGQPSCLFLSENKSVFIHSLFTIFYSLLFKEYFSFLFFCQL